MTFKEKLLGNLLTFQRGYDITKAEQTEGDIPIVSSSGVSSFHNESKAAAPGVVIGRKGTLGTVHYLDRPYWPHDTTLWVKDFKGSHPRFLSYFLSTLRLENFDTGASNPTLNRNHLHKIKVIAPAPKDQEKIAAVLATYDNLIANNQRRIALLESMTEEIYREWFARMRFPGARDALAVRGVPTGWVPGTLSELAIECGVPTTAGRHLEGRFYCPLDALGSKRMVPETHYEWDQAQSSLVTFNMGEILFGAMRPYQHKVSVAPFDGITRTTVFVLRPRQPEYYSYLFLTLFQSSSVDFATQICNGADRPYAVWNRGFEKLPVWIPDVGLAKRFDDLVRPMLDSLAASYFYLRSLAKQRDALLPRLISGKIRVDALDIKFPPSMRALPEETAQATSIKQGLVHSG